MKRCLESRTNENDEVYPTLSEKSKMFIVCREIFFVFAILFTAYATILNSQSRSRRGSPAVPFFQNENVIDFYQGDLKQLMNDISEVDFSFVMFYAPWDADCQDVKKELIEVSEFYSNQVYFAAVNCWEPGSECRSTFKEVVYHFPHMVAYLGPQKAVEFKGPYTADHIIKFIHSVIHPMHKINTVTDLWHLRYLHDAVLVGHLMFYGNKPGKGYQVLYDTSLRLASRDHERHTAIAVFTHTIANGQLGVTKTPTFVLYLWNKKIEYSGPLKTSELIKWVLIHTQKGLAELNSNTLLPNMKSGAVMVMFTPRHPLSTVIPYYHMIRRIAMNFNFCNNGTSILPEEDFFSYVLQYSKLYTIGYEQDVINSELLLREKCVRKNKLRRQLVAETVSCSPKVSSHFWDNMTCYNSMQFCPNWKLMMSNYKNEKQLKFYKKDKRSTERVIALAEEETCAILERTPLPLIPKPSFNLTHLPSSCEINSSFSFIALDSEQYAHLANGLGIQLKKLKHRTTVVIFDDEEVLKLDTAEVTELSVANLLKRYFAGERNRSLRSKKDSLHLHSVIKQQTNNQHPSISIIELDTHTFHEVALNKSMSVAVLYHSSYCSFCLGISNLFLTLAHLLRNVNNLLLVRLDGELNDLPWQYTVPSYPSIIFFPAQRKSESRIFPQTSPLTFHTLSKFILSNLKVYERISVMLALCSRWGDDPLTSDKGERCLQNVRSSSLDGISDTLNEYRRILLRLKYCSSRIIKAKLKYKLRQLFRYLEFLKIAHLQLARVKNLQKSVVYLEKLKYEIIISNISHLVEGSDY